MKKLFLIVSVLFSLQAFTAPPGELIRSLPVQDSGRIKPYDSFARETLELIYGKSSYKRQSNGEYEQKSEPAYLIVLSFIMAP